MAEEKDTQQNADDSAEDMASQASEELGRSQDLADDAEGAEGAHGDTSDDPLSAALAEIEDLKDQLLRSAAETENIRRRTTREKENAHKFALEKFVDGLLPVLDSFDKAVEAGAGDETGGGADAVLEGVRLSNKLFVDTLQRFGVERIDPHGEPFDPQKHEAIGMVDAPDAEPNSVINVLQAGYELNGRLVRAAMVMVSKGSPASAGTGGNTGGNVDTKA